MFRGVYCPVITAFGEDGSIDYRAQELIVERLIEKGVDGILFCGSIGEFPSLADGEKRELFRWAVKTVRGRVKVLAGTGGTRVLEAVDLTRECLDMGVDGAVVISPYYFQLDERALYDYFAQIAGVGLPVILYNFPQRTQVSLSAWLVVRLAADFKSIVGIKDTVDSMSHARELIASLKTVRNDFSVLSGFDEYFIPNLMSGGDGVLCGLTNVVPELFVGIWAAFERGNFEILRTSQLELNRMMALYSLTEPFLTAVKYAVHLIIPEVGEYTRPPFSHITDDEREAVKKVMS